MSKTNQRKLSLMMAVCLIATLFSFTRTTADEILPYYNNVSRTNLDATVDENGELEINYLCIGTSGITSQIVMTTYVEKRFLGVFWNRIELNSSETEWVHTIKSYQYIGSRSLTLPSKGTYRITVTYETSGTGGATDEITLQETVTY